VLRQFVGQGQGTTATQAQQRKHAFTFPVDRGSRQREEANSDTSAVTGYKVSIVCPLCVCCVPVEGVSTIDGVVATHGACCRPAKRHSNPRKTALEKGVFSMLPPSSCETPSLCSFAHHAWAHCPITHSLRSLVCLSFFVVSTKGSVGSVRSTNAVKPVLTPSLAASVGVAVADASMVSQDSACTLRRLSSLTLALSELQGQHLLDISTADINGGLKGKRLTRSASTTPNALARAAGAPFTADFAASGTADGLSPWLMSAVSTIEAPSNGSSSYLPSSTGLGLTPGLSLTPLVAKGSVSDAGAWLLPDEPILGARSTRNRSK
jgi:hypothetical protein